MWAAAILLSSAILAANECQRALNLNVQPARDNHVVMEEMNARIAANPADACAFNNRARLHVFFGTIADALSDYASALRLDPNLAYAYKNRGDLWLSRNQLERAIDDYGAALRIDPDYAPARHQRGLALYRKRDHAQAIADFSVNIKAGRGGYIARADAYRDSGQLERALADYMVVIKTSQRDPLGWLGRASLRVLSGDDRGAIADYDKALHYDQRDATTVNLRGAAKLRLGDRDGAVADFRKALELTPGLESARAGLEQLGVAP